MSVEWYDMIAKKNGGYKSNAMFIIEGTSGEDIFETRLIEMIKNSKSVLDAGCGHGEFTIKMAKYTREITGFDNSSALLNVAYSLKEHYKANNVKFVNATTKTELPFDDEQFDLIYSRRGPASIAKHSRILRSGGIIYGICSEYPDIINTVIERLTDNGFINIETEIYDGAVAVFQNENEFAKFLSAFPGNPDYELLENKQLLNEKVKENTVYGRLCYKQWRFIWKAIKA